MRVLFLTGEYPPMQGGVGDYTWALGTALNGLGADVHVLTSRKAGPTHLAPQGVANVYPEIEKWSWKLSSQVAHFCAELQLDILHIQYQSAAFDLHPAINFLPYLLKKQRWPRRVAVTFHDLLVPYLFPKAGPLRWQANLSLAGHCDAIIVTNAEDYARLQQYDRLAGRLIQVPIGSNIRPDPPAQFDRRQQRLKWGVAEEDLLLSYFGFLNASKGGEDLVEALLLLVKAGLPAHLLMVGGQVGASDPTNAACLERVKASIAGLRLSDRVHWTGFTAAEEVTANLLASDIVVLPYRDGASFRRGSLMAALTHGMPVVSTEPAVAIAEMIHGENIWLVSPGNPKELAEGIQRLSQDPILRQRLGENARELAGLFTWEAIAQRHLEIYRGLFDKPQNNRAPDLR